MQVPIALVSPGTQPRTKKERVHMQSSGLERMLWASDLQDYYRPCIPIVIAWNGQAYYTPTEVMSAGELNDWKISLAMGLCESTLEMVSGIDTEMIGEETHKQELGTLKRQLQSGIQVFKSSGTTFSTGKIHLNPNTAPFYGAHGSEVVTPSAASQGSSSESHAQPGKKRIYKCSQCSKTFSRSMMRNDHFAQVHQGMVFQCNKCVDKKTGVGPIFAAKRSLEQHMRTAHENKWRYLCHLCAWHTDNHEAVDSHMVKKHKQGNTVVCPTCAREFPGEKEVRRHQREGACKSSKNFVCDICSRSYNSHVYLQNHLQRCHLANTQTEEEGPVASEEAAPHAEAAPPHGVKRKDSGATSARR